MQEELKTERLLLRPLRAADAERLAALADNWNVARMLSRMPFPYTLDMAHEWIGKQSALRAGGEEHAYALDLDGDFIGTCGVQAHADGTHEIGYWVGEPYWNRGYASEAATAVLAAAVARFGGATLDLGPLRREPCLGPRADQTRLPLYWRGATLVPGAAGEGALPDHAAGTDGRVR